MHQTEHQQQPQHTQEPAQASSKAWDGGAEGMSRTQEIQHLEGVAEELYLFWKQLGMESARAERAEILVQIKQLKRMEMEGIA